MIISFIIGAALYIVQAMAVYNIAAERGLGREWFAFIPVLNVYLLGKIADDIKGCDKKRTSYRFILLFAVSVITVMAIVLLIVLLKADTGFINGENINGLITVLKVCGVIEAACGIALTVCYFVVYYIIYNDYTSGNAVLYTFLSIFLSFLIPFLLYSASKGISASLRRTEEEKSLHNLQEVF